MIIREAKESDIPEILKVLKASLGEVSSKKTEEVWRFKHLENPFGKSLVLIAVEDEKVIGVRAFMRWKWQFRNKIYSAYRAVDTATHPDHRGKGIFKKLTLAAVERGNSEGSHFIFNTPNDQSRPGYLKMGWQEVGRLKIELAPANPFNIFKETRKPEYKIQKTLSLKQLEDLLQVRNKELQRNVLFTPKDTAFLFWRYENNPLQKYQVVCEEGFYVAVYIKPRGKWKELRIAEKICQDKNYEKKANKTIMRLSKAYGAHFISSKPDNSVRTFLKFRLNLGPVFTLRNLNLEVEEYSNYRSLSYWNYSIGDLELF